VTLAVRDVAPWIDEALDSVLAQIGPDDEVIVVDDGSTDATPALLSARSEAVTVLSPGAIGLSNARNLALDHSTGRLMAFLDGDDRWAPGALDRLVAVLDEHPEADLALGRTDEFLDSSVTDPAAIGLRTPQRDALGWFLGALVARRDITDAVRFDPDQPLALTGDWLARLRARDVHIHELAAVTLERRLRPGSLTTDATAYREAMLRSLRTNLRRARTG